MGERQFGPYRLVHQIAVGGMAEIHLARAHGIAGFEKYVALKMIHPDYSQDEQFIQMLIDEAKLSVQLQHVNIAQTFDLGRVDDTFYITMEYVDGPDLYGLLRTGSEAGKDVPVAVAAHIAKEITNGLDYAHRKRDITGRSLGIVHRDVSPQNVLISHAGEVKIIDFGIAKASMRARQTQAGIIKGKYYYMSPEQAWGEKLDHRTDVFSAGIILWEMLAGQMLYLEEDLRRLLELVRRADIEPPSKYRTDVPPELEAIAMRALHKKPEERYQSAGDMAQALERFLHGYAPVFTASKVSQWAASVLGPEGHRGRPPSRAESPRVEQEPRRGTHRLTREQLILTREEFADENSIIFNVNDMNTQAPTPSATPPGKRSERARSVDDPTRAFADPMPSPGYDADFGDDEDDDDGGFGDGDRTMISDPPGFAIEDEETTVAKKQPPDEIVTRRSQITDDDFGVAPTVANQAHAVPTPRTEPYAHGRDDESTRLERKQEATRLERKPAAPDDTDGETTTQDGRWEPAPALGAGVPQPAVSALHKPRPSRRTPSGGVARPSVLHSLLDDGRPQVALHSPHPTAAARPLPHGGPQPGADFSGGAPVPQPAPQQQPVDPLAATMAPGAMMSPVHGYPPAAPPPNFPPPAPMLSGQMGTRTGLAAYDVDELPPSFKLSRLSQHRRGLWIGLAVALAIAAISIAAVVLSGKDSGGAAAEGAVITIVSSPEGATVTVDGVTLPEKTPTELTGAEIGQTYAVALQLDGYHPWSKDYAATEKANTLVARLRQITVELRITSVPSNAEVFLNGKSYGRTPLSLSDLVPERASSLELRMPGYRPVVRELDWSDGEPKRLDIELEK